MTELQKLKAKLQKFGFKIAAEAIEDSISEGLNVKHALKSWNNYPKCMDRFATHIRKASSNG